MKQVGWLFLGVVFMVLVLAFVKNLDKLGSYKYTIMIAGILLLMSPMLPVIGNEIYGSRIWLSIGGFSIQPGELAKICIVIFLAAYLAQNREMLSVFNHKPGALPCTRHACAGSRHHHVGRGPCWLSYSKRTWVGFGPVLRVRHNALRGHPESTPTSLSAF